jgi:hypothetical protein
MSEKLDKKITASEFVADLAKFLDDKKLQATILSIFKIYEDELEKLRSRLDENYDRFRALNRQNGNQDVEINKLRSRLDEVEKQHEHVYTDGNIHEHYSSIIEGIKERLDKVEASCASHQHEYEFLDDDGDFQKVRTGKPVEAGGVEPAREPPLETPTCPKCKNTDIHRIYCTKEIHNYPSRKPDMKVEHFDFHCRGCSYEWCEAITIEEAGGVEPKIEVTCAYCNLPYKIGDKHYCEEGSRRCGTCKHSIPPPLNDCYKHGDDDEPVGETVHCGVINKGYPVLWEPREEKPIPSVPWTGLTNSEIIGNQQQEIKELRREVREEYRMLPAGPCKECGVDLRVLKEDNEKLRRERDSYKEKAQKYDELWYNPEQTKLVDKAQLLDDIIAAWEECHEPDGLGDTPLNKDLFVKRVEMCLEELGDE